MFSLLLILLLFGLAQSLLQLWKDNETDTKSKVSKSLAIVYVLGFLVGAFVLFFQDRDSNKVNNLINKISLSVTKIDSSSMVQLENLSKSLEESKSLVKAVDSMNNSMVEIIKIRDTLIAQTKNINDKLRQQLVIDEQLLREKEADIAFMNYDVNWITNTTKSESIEACIRNFGKRNANVNSLKGYVVFFDNDKKPFLNLPIPGNSSRSLLEPHQPNQAKLCIASVGIFDIDKVKPKINFGIICLKVNYKDVLFEKEKIKDFYMEWTPLYGSTIPRDWKLELAKAWAKDNYKF